MDSRRGEEVHMRCIRLSMLALILAGCSGDSRTTTPAISGEFPASRGPATGGLAEATAVALSGWLPDQLNERGVPGAAAAVVDNSEIIWDLLRELHREEGLTIVVATHNPDLVHDAGHLIRLEDGVVMSDEKR